MRSLLAAAVTGAVLATASPAHAADLAPGVGQRVVFNDPHGTTAQRHAVIHHLERSLDLAAPGTKAYVVSWRLNRPESARALLAAVDRGVDLRVALTGHSWNYAETTWLAAELAKRGQSARLVKCSSSTYDNGSCLGKRAGSTEHNKWAIFERLTDGRRWVVQSTSHNLSNGQVGTYNDVLELTGDQACYAKFETVARDTMTKQRDNAYRQNRGTWSCPASLVEVRTGPSDPVNKPDDYVTLLRTFDGRPGCRAYAPQSQFENTRSKVATELRRLKSKGAYVGVLSRIPSGSGSTILTTLAGTSSSSDDIPWRTGHPHQHIKGLIVQGCLKRGTSTPAEAVSVHGSEHWTGDVWRNSEQMIVTRYGPVVQQSAAWFEQNARRAGLPL